MNTLSGGFQSIQKCAALLRSGDVLGIPTETVYGLAANAFDEKAVAKIFAAKERPTFDPLIVHVPTGWGSLRKLDELGITESSLLSPEARTTAEKFMKAFWPGPFTMVLPRGARIPDLVTSGLSTVGVRMPRHTITQDLLKAVQLPLAAPSANRFGRISPTTSSAVVSELNGRVQYVLEGGPCEVGLESTIIHIAPDATLTLLRPGAISREELSQTSGREVRLPDRSTSGKSSAELAPGMLASHYAPGKSLTLGSMGDFRALMEAHPTTRWGALVLDPASAAPLAASKAGSQLVIEKLSEDGDWAEAARALFGALRRLDEFATVDRIFAEDPRTTALPERSGGMAAAILDRLTRAAAPRH
jgi:L-threonylcarbamoyladenylate synthase